MQEILLCLDCGCPTDSKIRKCNKCGSENMASIGSGNIKVTDTKLLLSISKDKNFIEAMARLHDTDIIEYTTKMNVFKQQANSHKSQIKCPRCGSTNIQVLRRMYGEYASFEVDRVCVNCKHQF